MAINIFSIPAITDDPEQVFSGVRRIISWERARLRAVMIKKLECLKNWIKVRISGVDTVDYD